MNSEKFEELLSLDKKPKASQEKKKQFTEQMVELLNADGYSDANFSYISRGYGFAGAKPVAIYLQRMPKDQRDQSIEKLFSKLMKRTEKTHVFRITISLMAYALEWFSGDKVLLQHCIQMAPNVSKRKTGDLLAECPKTIQVSLIDVVSSKTELPALDTLELEQHEVDAFKNMMMQSMAGIAQKKAPNLAKFYNWISPNIEFNKDDGSQTVMEKDNEDIKETNTDSTQTPAKEAGVSHDVCVKEGNMQETENEEALAVETSEEKVNSPLAMADTAGNTEDIAQSVQESSAEKDSEINDSLVKAMSAAELAQGAMVLSSLAERLMAGSAVVGKMEKNHSLLVQENKKLVDQIENLEDKLKYLQKNCSDLKGEITEKSEIISSLKDQMGELKREKTQLQAQSTATEKEIVRLNSILSVYSADKENSQTEQLNAIASKLKSEYRDFKDAETEEMSIDLGENFRFQLQQIFKILAKAGIDVEKR